ncbi:uncharacterized protein DFL_006085 [Arthrobotrys flagrans]|uniref:RNase H type-1 domain-containing protein n=1 Tax=Arthrobotrys flagrans TaxID=97331 RepID=A0A437A048_ARTFL|nr:hypothetical protein DFL_006085 [Arthrobotrys flagrans]
MTATTYLFTTIALVGVGVAGTKEIDDLHVSKPFSDLVLDGRGSKRTSQIAELRAAIEAVVMIDRLREKYGDGSDRDREPNYRKRKHHRTNLDSKDPTYFIIAMDSEYVVKGMTDWLPLWKTNGFRNAKGHEPANLGLFLALERDICEVEQKWDIIICFWWVPRECNKIADKLAKNAAKLDTGDN